MNNCSRPLVVGIGSPHGDDQAGWLLIEHLTTTLSSHPQLKKALVPHNVMDWMNDCASLHIVDACESGDSVKRIEVSEETSAVRIERLTRCHGSHDFGIGEVIELGKMLGLLPRRIVVWAIPGESFEPGNAISEFCRQKVVCCAKLLSKELDRA